jgi:excisionase family DNA binding protein
MFDLCNDAGLCVSGVMAEVLLTVKDAAQRLNISVAGTYEMIHQGILPAVFIGRVIRVAPAALDEFISKGGKRFPGGWRKEAE